MTVGMDADEMNKPMLSSKILFTADLHLNIEIHHTVSGRTGFHGFVKAMERENPDAVVIAGDLSVPSHTIEHLQAIRKAVGDRPLAVCLGNHDMWVGRRGGPEHQLLENIITDFWVTPCKENGIVLLDRENAMVGEVTIVGGYGHFDLGLAWPDLVLDGERVKEKDYLRGADWNDFVFIPKCAEYLRVNARAQADAIANRLDQAIAGGGRILMATHTLPWAELNGHKRSGKHSDMYTAYSGNSLMGEEIRKRAWHIEFLIFGHTHSLVKQRKLHGIRSLNVGGDYGHFRGVIYDTADKSIRWIE